MNKNIAVIEDDRDILDLIEYILTDEGYNIKLYDRIAPIDHIITQQPAVILLDNRLANGFGTALCLSLKSNEKTQHIPVILVSASSDIQKIAADCGADAFLPKPFDLDELIKLVKRYAGGADVSER